jgi:predicted ABC-type transport system involved in lysophospholipase L1 biosynthesis ATPase subunit
MTMNDNPIAALEQAHAALQNRAASVAQLRDAAEQARGVVRGIDTESESAPQREAQILTGMASPGGPSMDYVLKALASLDDEFVTRALMRKVAVGLAAQLDERVREVEAREAAKPPEQVRREQEQARREAEKEALFARIPVLFRTDFMASQFGKAAYSRTPPPQGVRFLTSEPSTSRACSVKV